MEIVSVSVLSELLSLDKLSCPQVWSIEQETERESREQVSEAQREKGEQRSRAKDRKQMKHFFVGRTTKKFCSAGGKMRNASGHQCGE